MDQDAVATCLRLALELPFVAFHASILICILYNMQKGSFRTNFFKLYTLLCVADLVEYSAVSFKLGAVFPAEEGRRGKLFEGHKVDFFYTGKVREKSPENIQEAF